MTSNIQELNMLHKACIRTVLDICKRAKAGHIGSSLSCLNILIYIFFRALGKNDKFVLSKGHAAAGLYVVLAKANRISQAMLDTFYTDGTMLAGHPPCSRKIEDIPFGTGSLGHGLSLTVGMAFAQRYTHKNRKIFCVVSEGDLNEGSSWEALLFAAQHKLDNLIIIVDRNRQQGFGATEDIMGLESLSAKLLAFNIDVIEVPNGNNFEDIELAFNRLATQSGKPHCLIAQTTKGNGVSFMENNLEWHYLSMNDEQYSAAIAEVERL